MLLSKQAQTAVDPATMFGLYGRTALVTGASRGIGEAIATAFAAAGADVIVHFATRADVAEQVAARIRALGRRAHVIGSDLSTPHGGEHLATAALDAAGQIDILVLNAAVQIRQPLAEVDDTAFDLQANSGFRCAWDLARRLVPIMATRGWGRVVTIGSVQQWRPNPELSVYGAMKCAQAHLARNLARAFAGRGVTANNIAPGLIDTERCADLKADHETWSQLIDRIPVGRAGLPRDVAGLVLALASEAGAYVTGADIPVDGGAFMP